MAWDVLVIVLLLGSTAVGVVCLERHREIFQRFRLQHLLQGRLDAVLYVLVQASTCLVLVDAVLRLLWVLEIGWDSTGGRWQYFWLCLHAAIAVKTAGFHFVTNKLLACPGVRQAMVTHGENDEIGLNRTGDCVNRILRVGRQVIGAAGSPGRDWFYKRYRGRADGRVCGGNDHAQFRPE